MFWSKSASLTRRQAGRQGLPPPSFQNTRGFNSKELGAALKSLRSGKYLPSSTIAKTRKTGKQLLTRSVVPQANRTAWDGGVGNRGGGRGFDLTQTPLFHHFPNTRTHKRTRTHRHADTWTHRHTDKTPQFSLKCEKCEENFWNTQFRLWPNTCVYYTHSALFSHFHINSSSTIFSDF